MPQFLINILILLGGTLLGGSHVKILWDAILFPKKRKEFQKLIGKPDLGYELMKKVRRNSGDRAGYQVFASFFLPVLFSLLSFFIIPESFGLFLWGLGGFLVGSIFTIEMKLFQTRIASHTLVRPNRLMDRMEQIAMGALLEDGSDNALETIKRNLERVNDPISVNTVLALADSGKAEALPMLENVLRHPTPEIVLFAALSLKEQDYPRFQKNLATLTGHKDADVLKLFLNNLSSFSEEDQLLLLGKAGQGKKPALRAEISQKRQTLKAADEIGTVKRWINDPSKNEWKEPLKRLLREMNGGTSQSVLATKVALGNPPEWSAILPLLQDLKRKSHRPTLVPVARHLGRQKSPESRAALGWLLGESNSSVKETAFEQLQKDEGLSYKDLSPLLNSLNPEIRTSALYLATDLEDTPRVVLAEKFMDAEEEDEVRISGVRLLYKVKSGPKKRNLLRIAFAAGGLLSRTAFEVNLAQGDMDALLLFREWFKNLQKDSGYAGNAVSKSDVFAAGNQIIAKQQASGKDLRKAFCTKCQTRTIPQKLGPWKLYACRACKTREHLTTEYAKICGVIGPLKLENKGQKVLEISLWNEASKRASYADIDTLLIREGQEMDYDWAVNATLERLTREIWFRQKAVKLEIEGEPGLSENSTRLLEGALSTSEK